MYKALVKKLSSAYAWVILGIFFLGLLASHGVRSSFGAYVNPWETDFSVSRTVVTSISTLSFIVYAIAQPLSGKLNDSLGGRIVPSFSLILIGLCFLLSSVASQIWQLFILYGVVLSLGVAGSSNVIVTSILSNWFKEKRGFALGLAVSGMAVGQLIVVPASLFLIENYSWRISLRIIGIIILVAIVPLMVIFVRSKPEELGLRPYGDTSADNDIPVKERQAKVPQKTASLFSVIKLKSFWKLAAAYFVCGFTDVGIIGTHLIPYTQGKYFNTATVAATLSTIAAFNIIGSIVTGHLSDRYNRSRQLGIIFAVRAATFIFLMSIKSSWLLIPFAVFYGSTEMASIAPANSLAVNLFEKYPIGTIVGLISLSHQLGGAVGSWIPGLIYDISESYVIIFVLSSVLLIAVSLISLSIPEPKKELLRK